jgi:hypothetical protein
MLGGIHFSILRSFFNHLVKTLKIHYKRNLVKAKCNELRKVNTTLLDGGLKGLRGGAERSCSSLELTELCEPRVINA